MQLFCQTNVPVNQNLLYKTAEEARNSFCGNVDIHCNEYTGFIYNKAFDPDLVNFSEDYNNNQYHSSYFATYIGEQINWLTAKFGQSDLTILEIGCGKGYYSRLLAEKFPSCKVYGFDTSYTKGTGDNLPNLRFYNEYFTEKYSYLCPDVVICRHVIEHIQDPLDFLTKIRATIPENTLFFLETRDVNWILENTVIFDFFCESCSYFNPSSLGNVLCMAGFESIETRRAFGGQYMWSVARATTNNKHPTTNTQQQTNKQLLNLCQNFVYNYKIKYNNIISAVKEFSQKEKVFVWGAGAKGVTFVNMFDHAQEYISGIIDINPDKQGCYVGITAHKVISAKEALDKYDIGAIIVLNANYLAEIKEYLASLAPDNKIQLYTIS